MRHLEEYLRYLESKGYTAGTIKSCETDVAQLGRRSQKDEQQIIVRDIQFYHQHLKTLPIQKSTVAIKLKNIKRYFAYLVSRDHLLIDPTKDLEITYEKDGLTKEILTVEEMNTLLDSPSQSIVGIRDKAVMEVLYSTGMRGSDVCALDIQDLNLKEKEVNVKDLKNRTERRVPLARQSRAVLIQYLLSSRKELLGRRKFETAFFLKAHGQRLDKALISGIIKKYVKRAGLTKHITPHCLRHSCATHMLENGAPVEIIQQMLGHQCLSSTEIYIHVLKDDLKKIQNP